MKRNVLVVLVVLLVGLAALWYGIGRSSPAGAQSDGVERESSANTPEGTLPEQDASAGNSGPIEPEEFMEGGGLISWRVTGSALQPRENNVTYSVNSNGSCSYVTAGSTFTVWNTPVHLPNGSVVDTLRMYYYDTSASSTTGWFTVYDLYGVIVDEWSVVSTSNVGNSFNDSAQINHTIDYSIYNYVINWRPNVTGSTVQLCGFRVFYTPPPYGLGFVPAVFNP
jgi:hypothetical protein